MPNRITLKMQPQLLRKRIIVKNTTIKIVVKPTSGRATNLNDFTRRQTKQPPPPNIPAGAVVSKQHFVKKPATNHKKTPKIKYLSRDITQDSLTRIKQLKGCGRGKILVIIGNGPSINQVPLDQLKSNDNIHVMSINKPDVRVWPTTYWVFFDQSQLRRNEDIWAGYSGIIFNSTAIKRQKENSLQLKNLGGKGFSRDLTKGLHIGRSSVFAAMQISYWLDYVHTYIFGCDMNPAGLDGQLHFYGVNPDVDPNVRRDRFKKEAEYYDYAADILTEHERSKYTFCSSENHCGFVDKFNKLDHKTSIESIIAHTNKLQSTS